MQTVMLQLERLRRHYESAVKTYDEVSILDLAHTLRIWTELKIPLKTLAPKFSEAYCFITGMPPKKVLRAARGYKCVFSYMPGGVITYASQGHLFSTPEALTGEFTGGVAVKNAGAFVEIGMFMMVHDLSDSPDLPTQKANSEQRTRCNFIQWLASDAVKLSYINEAGVLEVVSLTREIIIKRVANTMDASHASAASAQSPDASENRFDAPVKHLLHYKWGDCPCPISFC